MNRSYKSSRFLVGTLYKMYFSSIYPDIKGKNPAAFAFSPMETHSFQVIPYKCKLLYHPKNKPEQQSRQIRRNIGINSNISLNIDI